jgi:hypothetical protein
MISTHMTTDQIDKLLRARFNQVETGEDQWKIQLDGFEVVVIADGDSDRLRVMVPVAAVDRSDSETFRVLLEANFLTTLDARYAIYNGVLWALFLAPLGAIPEHIVDAAITQVVELARTTGSSYSSSPVALGARPYQIH